MNSYGKRRSNGIKNVKELADMAFEKSTKENIETLFEALSSSGVSLKTAGVPKRKQNMLNSKLKPLRDKQKKKNNNGKKQRKRGHGRFVSENNGTHNHNGNGRILPEKNLAKIQKGTLHIVHCR